ncbi:UTRA domain-containing protein [Paenibacillus sp. JX-17]|uniref:UTRA domain-containing protein n=1 Tax=Paenibacillus lacisoli TaxID=3064525 RepID=A0ABT9CER8_9BACL|nr:UTRA domain-containing protein [Paenibacillus sp. JX-17]MDO7907134.1 UTRA domain-containing protein [Paenibacillus sp. JX-17]
MSPKSALKQPLYGQIRQKIINDIHNGTYATNQKIPTEAELCKQYQVSRITIRKAVEDLVKDGRLTPIPGKGTFVTAPKVHNELVSVSGFAEFSSHLGAKSDSRIIRSAVISAPPSIAERLGIEEGAPVFELERVMSVNERPLFHDVAHYSLDRFPGLELKIQPETSTYSVLKQDYHTLITSNDKLIDVVSADTVIASHLECDPGAILFRIQKTAYGEDKRPVHLSTFMCETSKVSLTVHSDS